jgi:hypothetical protein
MGRHIVSNIPRAAERRPPMPAVMKEEIQEQACIILNISLAAMPRTHPYMHHSGVKSECRPRRILFRAPGNPYNLPDSRDV